MKTVTRIINPTDGFSDCYLGDCMKKATLVLLVLAIFATALIAGCTQQQAQPTPKPTPVQPADTIRTASSSLGTILTDTKGMTLYYFITDIPASGTSTCYAAANCTTFWPIFSVDSIVVSPPLNAADFSSITRTDGTKQTTYLGWPLYYFQKDTIRGDIKGENVLKAWYVAKPDYTGMIASRPALGAFLTDKSGKTLYFFTSDTTGTSTCTGTCLAKWPAFDGGTVRVPSVLKSSDFGTVTRADGVKQTSFMGRPLYFFSGDVKPGDITGQGVNNVWYVAYVSGITPVIPAIPTPLRTLSSSYGVSY
jgi:predicted lipoprotein with Yx(FWY)xxD motif